MQPSRTSDRLWEQRLGISLRDGKTKTNFFFLFLYPAEKAELPHSSSKDQIKCFANNRSIKPLSMKFVLVCLYVCVSESVRVYAIKNEDEEQREDEGKEYHGKVKEKEDKSEKEEKEKTKKEKKH